MRSVTVARSFPGTVSEAERCWYDTERWYRWVDGLDRVLAVDRAWPDPGGSVRWESNPAGRGQVTERVVAREPRHGQTLEVQDASIRGRQRVAFAALDPGVEVTLTLEYEIERRTPLTPLVDLLFIRRAMATSLATTVSRFGIELQAARQVGGS
jgi:Polyketide cyclase / dehydrase and lipid transport